MAARVHPPGVGPRTVRQRCDAYKFFVQAVRETRAQGRRCSLGAFRRTGSGPSGALLSNCKRGVGDVGAAGGLHSDLCTFFQCSSWQALLQ